MFPPIPDWDALHPLIVHFPIALLLVAPVFLVLGLMPRRHGSAFAVSALVLVTLGTIGTYLAVATGEAAGEMVVRTPQISAALERHEELAETVRIFFTALTLILGTLVILPAALRTELGRKVHVSLHLIFLALYVAGALTLVGAAHQGGRMVHELGVRAGAAARAGDGASPADLASRASSRDGGDSPGELSE